MTDIYMARSAVLVGFLPKKTVKRPNWLKNEEVEEIGSVSECISEGPDDWRQRNELGFYDSESSAVGIVGSDKSEFDMYAYKLFPMEFDGGQASRFDIPVRLVADLTGYNLLGYDASNRSAGSRFECSALSCNGGARDFPVNRYCLFEDFDIAYDSTKIISQGHYEPGPWYILEVHRKMRYEVV